MMKTNDPFCKLSKTVLARKDIRATDKIVHAYLLDRIGDHEVCWPGKRTIARECGLSVDTIQASIKRLEAAGMICVDRQNPRRTYYRAGDVQCTENQYVPETSTYRESVDVVPKTSTQVYRGAVQNKTDPIKTHPKARKEPDDVRWDSTEERFIVSPRQLARWERDFPGVNVEAEILKAGAWQASKRRWKSRFKAALARWLSNAGQKTTTPSAKSRFTPAKADTSAYDTVVVHLGDDDE
jgi:predicted transcriptional regulator